MVRILDNENSVMNRFIAELRDVEIQRDSMRFRCNLERMGEIMAYEISKTMHYSQKMIETPLGEISIPLIDEDIVIATVLRAGLPFHQGFLNYFDKAESAFITAYRKYSKDGTFNIKIEYVSSCDLAGKTLILVDPMLATGASIALTYKALVEKAGMPRYTHIAAVISSEEGLEYTKKHFSPKNTTVWSGCVDTELTVKSYIVPGLGDAGDLAYGEKM